MNEMVTSSKSLTDLAEELRGALRRFQTHADEDGTAPAAGGEARVEPAS